MLYFGTKKNDPEQAFSDGINESCYSDENEVFGKGNYFYKTAAAVADVAFEGIAENIKGSKFILFGPVIVGKTTTQPPTTKG